MPNHSPYVWICGLWGGGGEEAVVIAASQGALDDGLELDCPPFLTSSFLSGS